MHCSALRLAPDPMDFFIVFFYAHISDISDSDTDRTTLVNNYIIYSKFSGLSNLQFNFIIFTNMFTMQRCVIHPFEQWV